MKSKRILFCGLGLFFLATACSPPGLTDDVRGPAPVTPDEATAAPLSPRSSGSAEPAGEETPAAEGQAAPLATAVEDLGPATLEAETIITLPEATTVTVTPDSGIPEDSSAGDYVTLAKEDLGQRLQIEADTIEVVRSEEVVWRDGSLGCPQPKMSYIQVLISGYRIQLSANGQLYDYHGADGQAPFLCNGWPGQFETPPLPGSANK